MFRLFGFFEKHSGLPSSLRIWIYLLSKSSSTMAPDGKSNPVSKNLNRTKVRTQAGLMRRDGCRIHISCINSSCVPVWEIPRCQCILKDCHAQNTQVPCPGCLDFSKNTVDCPLFYGYGFIY